MSKQIVINDENSLLQLKTLSIKNNWKRLFLVTGNKSFESTGAKDKIFSQFSKEQIIIFNDFEINPKLKDVYKGLDSFSASKADAIISIGGGTAIDMSKLINGFFQIKGRLEDYVTGKFKIESVAVPHVAVPTTSGSGSEATHFAVVYLDGIKYSIACEYLLPSYLILDANLTQSLPPYITAYTAVDALCQAMESFWSVSSTKESTEYSSKAIELILKNIRNVVKYPTLENRKAIQEAAYLSGKSINITKTTAAHALSYFITSRFGLPHGHAVGLMFGWVYLQNSLLKKSSCIDPRGVDFVRERLTVLKNYFDAETFEDFPRIFYNLMKDLGLKINIIDWNNKIVEELFNSINIERLVNNPVKLDKANMISFKEFFMKTF